MLLQMFIAKSDRSSVIITFYNLFFDDKPTKLNGLHQRDYRTVIRSFWLGRVVPSLPLWTSVFVSTVQTLLKHQLHCNYETCGSPDWETWQVSDVVRACRLPYCTLVIWVEQSWQIFHDIPLVKVMNHLLDRYPSPTFLARFFFGTETWDILCFSSHFW